MEPVLDKMRGWLRQKQDQVLPGSALGKAIAFALGQWRKLICYLDHPQLTPDNNSCEQAIRPFVIGRKNWLFSRQPARRHRKRTVIQLYSLIETAKANGRAKRANRTGTCVSCSRSCPYARTDYLALLPTARPPLPSP